VETLQPKTNVPGDYNGQCGKEYRKVQKTGKKVRRVYTHSDIARAIAHKSPCLQIFLPGSKGPKGPYSSPEGRDRPPLRFFICVFQSPPTAELMPLTGGKGVWGDKGDMTRDEGIDPGEVERSNGA
jgi:hypothetical protein